MRGNSRNYLLSSAEENTNNIGIYANNKRPELAPATMTRPQNATTNSRMVPNLNKEKEKEDLRDNSAEWIATLSNFLQQQSSILFPPTRTTESENDDSSFQNQNHSFSNVPQEEQQQQELTSYSTKSEKLPEGPRWAVSHPKVDFTGTWKPIVTEEFKDEYESYLKKCATSVFFRKVVINFASTTREVIQHAESGRKLHFHGKTPVGSWERTLVSSGADADSSHFEPHQTNFLDPDKERVYVEAWWEEDGTVHKSWLRGKPRVEGGAFESTRYIEACPTTGQDILVCESKFHPSKDHLNDRNSRFQPAVVRWKYHREEHDCPK